MQAVIGSDPRNAERIFPYLGGEEVNSNPTQEHYRWVIDFDNYPLRRESTLGGSWSKATKRQCEEWVHDGVVPSDYVGPVAADWPRLLEIVERRVKPERDCLANNADGRRRKKFWWQFGRCTPGLNAAISTLQKVIVTSQISAHHAFAIVPTGAVFANRLFVFAASGYSYFAVLQSSTHCIWSRSFGYTLEDRYGYSAENSFQTYPFPTAFETSPELDAAAKVYYDHRAALMLARNEGMTKTYNRFHDRSETTEDIKRLRELHAAMDHAVLEAYGWHDLAARADPIFLEETNEDDHTYQGRLFWPSDFRDEVLARLLALNAERHAEEVRLGIAPGVKDRAEEEGDDEELD